MKKSALVIGAGIGGMTAALLLQNSGFFVTVCEKLPEVGGKMYREEFSGCSFDTGPSLVTMPFVLRDIFASVGKSFDEYVTLIEIDPGCRYQWIDGTTFDAYATPEDLYNEIHNKFSEQDAHATRDYLLRAKTLYDVTKDVFLFNEFNGIQELFKWKNISLLQHLPSLKAHLTLHSLHSKVFESPKLQQLFDRFATYNGSSPYTAPATLSIIPHVEFGFGAWYPLGGVYSIAQAFRKICEESGVLFRTSTSVDTIVHNKNVVTGVRLTDGEFIESNIVISNADAYATHRYLLNKPLKNERELSCSGFSLLCAVKKKQRGIIHHNILFSDRYSLEFDDIFRKKKPSDSMTIYIANSSFTDSQQAVSDRENWFILVNAPSGMKSDFWHSTKEEYAEKILHQMSGYGIDIRQDIIEMRIRAPDDIEKSNGAYKGSLYGASSNSMLSAFLRQRNTSSTYKNLYFVGGSTHPGGGVPLVALSGTIVSQIIIDSFRTQ